MNLSRRAAFRLRRAPISSQPNFIRRTFAVDSKIQPDRPTHKDFRGFKKVAYWTLRTFTFSIGAFLCFGVFFSTDPMVRVAEQRAQHGQIVIPKRAGKHLLPRDEEDDA